MSVSAVPVPEAQGQRGLRAGLRDPDNYEHFSDAVVCCRGGVLIRTHRIVLAALSPMVRSALERDGLKEEDSVLLAPGVEPVELAEFLRGALRGGKELAPIPDSLQCMGVSYQPASDLNKVVAREEEDEGEGYDYYYGEEEGEGDANVMTYEPDVEETAEYLEQQEAEEKKAVRFKRRKKKVARKEAKKPSEAWKYFRKQGNGDSVECVQCKKIFSFTSGTSTMLRHLRKFHGLGGETASQNTIEIEGLCQWTVKPDPVAGSGRQQQSQQHVHLTTGLKPEPPEAVHADKLPTPTLEEDVEPLQDSPVKRPTKRSNIWKFYDRSEDKSTFTCLKCKKKFGSGSTSTLARHLKRKHEELYEEFEELNEQDKLERSRLQEEKDLEKEGETEAAGEGDEGKENQPKKRTQKQRSSVWKYFQKNDEGSACCNQCGKVFVISAGSTSGLIRHLGRVHGDAFDDIFKDMETKKKEAVAKLTYDWGSGSFVPKKKEKKERKVRKDKVDQSDPATRTCPVEGCGKVYSRRRRMLLHYEDVHSGRKAHQCNECGKTFSSKESWQRHSHDTSRPFLCPTCGKTFRTQRDRQRHERFHTDDRRYPCSYCEKRFFTSDQRKAHERIHTGEKPFGCNVCGKLFTASHQLATHTLIHTGERPHKCNYCAASFRYLSAKHKHNCPNKPIPPARATERQEDEEEEHQQRYQQATWTTLSHEEIAYQQQVQTVQTVKPVSKPRKRRRRY